MTSLMLNRRTSNTATAIRIPAWAIARRLNPKQTEWGASPDSLGKRTVQTVPSVDDEDSLALPRMATTKTATAKREADATATAVPRTTPTTLLKMDVTGFRAEDLHVEVDIPAGRLCLSGKGSRMFKRSFDLPAGLSQTLKDSVFQLHASIVLDELHIGRQFLVVQTKPATTKQEEDDDDDASSISTTATASTADTNATGRHNVPIQNDITRPPMVIQVPVSVTDAC